MAVVNHPLVFNPGETRVCHAIEILQDDMCENRPNEDFFSDLSYVSGPQPIIDPSEARVVIIDDGELECGKCGLCYIVMC